MQIGASINDVLTESDLRPGGKTMTPGITVTDSGGRIYVCVKVSASQNIINGNVCYFDSTSYTTTIMPSGPPTPAGVFGGTPLGVAVCSVTASASQFIFLQVYGAGNVRMTDTTASNLPGHILTVGSTPGELKGAAATASGYVSGITLLATVSVATLGACFINFPRVAIA